MSADRPFFITTPIYYVNDLPHLGHAYTTVACDALARFMRLDGRHVKFLTGTDEHGQKVAQSAAAAGVSPQEFADRNSARFREVTRLLNISHDEFIRTTEPRHTRAVQALWQELERRGEIYLGRFAGWYAVRDEAFYDESELVDGRAPTGAEVEWLEEENYFFRLSAWQDRLLAYYEANPEAVAPRGRRNEVISFIKGGLKDLSISRTSFTWGVPVPGHPGHVVYVWLDALINYITAAGYPDDLSAVFDLLAGRPSYGGQGHRALSCGLLAGLSDGGRAGRRRAASSPTAGGRWKARRCRNRSATSSRRSNWSTPTGLIRCAISCCANCRSAAMAIFRIARSWAGSTATSPMISAIWRSAFWS